MNYRSTEKLSFLPISANDNHALLAKQRTFPLRVSLKTISKLALWPESEKDAAKAFEEGVLGLK